MKVIRLDTLALSTLRGYQCQRGPGNKRVLRRQVGHRRVAVMEFEVMEAQQQREDTMQAQTIVKRPTMRGLCANLLLWLSELFLDSAHCHNREARRQHTIAMKRMDRAQKLQIKAKLLQG